MFSRKLYNVYKNVLATHTYKTQSVQSGILFGVGDILSQQMAKKPEEGYDYMRTVRFTIIGIHTGPAIHWWYKLLDRVIGEEKNLKNVVRKVAADQLIMAPVAIAWIMSASTLLRGGGVQEVAKDLKYHHRALLMDNYKVWPFVQMVTFALQINFRVLFQQVISLGWNTYLSYRINQA